MDVKIIMNKNVNYEIWLLDGLPGVDLLLLSLRHPFPQVLLMGGVSAAAHGWAATGNGRGWVHDGYRKLFPAAGRCSNRVTLEALVSMGPCTGLYGTTALIGGKAVTEPEARWPHPGHLTVFSSKPPVLGKPPLPRGMGTFPSPMGTGEGHRAHSRTPELAEGLFPEQGEGVGKGKGKK